MNESTDKYVNKLEDELIENYKWVSMATTFSLGQCRIQNRPVFIVAKEQINGSIKWAVCLESSKGWVLGKDGFWWWEPIPSNRTVDYLQNTRFATKGDALMAYSRFIKKGQRHTLFTDGRSEFED
jgi:hypothetical protein